MLVKQAVSIQKLLYNYITNGGCPIMYKLGFRVYSNNGLTTTSGTDLWEHSSVIASSPQIQAVPAHLLTFPKYLW